MADRTTRVSLAKARRELLELIDDIPTVQLAPRPLSAPDPEHALPRIPGRFGLRERGEETLITASGDAPPAIRRALTELER